MKAQYGLKPIDIAKAMLPEEIPLDVQYLVGLIHDICAA